MTTGPDNPQSEPPDPTQPTPAQPYDAPPPPPPPPPTQNLYGQPPVAGAPPGAYGVSSTAPYGIHPVTGVPYSDKSKLVAGLLQIFLPFGIGRFYIGDNKIGVIQLLVTLFTCGIGGIWSFVDGIIMLATDSKDVNGYMLRS